MLFKSVITLTAFIASFSLSVNAAVCSSGHGGPFCLPCSPGSFSPGHTSHCQPCPPGQGSNWGASSCGTCPAGEYSKGGTACMACPLGKFSSQAGSSGCCECCQGWKPSGGDFFGFRSTSCTSCSAGKSSNAGDAACSFNNHKSKTTTCAQSASGFCPATAPGGPSGLPLKKRSPLSCRSSYSACPHISGRGGWDCVDTKNDAEMCGGCVSLDGTTSENEGAGQDCTAIPNVNIVKCKKGGCVIESCRKGFTQSEDGKSCVHVSEHPSVVEGALGSLFFPS